MKGFDKHIQEILGKNQEVSHEYAKVFAELPLATQLAIMRRRRKFSQRGLAKKLKVLQPHVARIESLEHDSRISSIVRAAKAIKCHVMLIPDEAIERFAI
jgi:hypothetical protein